MKLSKELILKSILKVKDNIDFQNNKLMVFGHPTQFEPIHKDIEWITDTNNNDNEVTRNYCSGTLRLSDDIIVDITSSKLFDINKDPGIMVIPTNKMLTL